MAAHACRRRSTAAGHRVGGAVSGGGPPLADAPSAELAAAQVPSAGAAAAPAPSGYMLNNLGPIPSLAVSYEAVNISQPVRAQRQSPGLSWGCS